MSFSLAAPDEVLRTLGQRLRALRLVQEMSQQELAQMAGLSLGAVRKLERDGQSSLATLVRVAQALGVVVEMEPLFVPQRRSIAQMKQLSAARQRQRAPRRKVV